MAKLFISFILLFSLIACAPTQELQRSQKKIAERQALYSQQAGTLYRHPPTHEPFEQKNQRVPEGMAVAYSPLTGKTTLVPKRKPVRAMKAAPLASTRGEQELVAAYSPLTGEAIWVPRQKRARR